VAEKAHDLTKMPKAVPSDLKELVSRLPQPMHQLLGRPATTLELPDNLVCFQRPGADEPCTTGSF
jgi:hypothetical protein